MRLLFVRVAYLFEGVFRSLDPHQLSHSIMCFLSVVHVLVFEHGHVSDIGGLVDAFGELACTGLVASLAVGLSEDILALDPWDITSVAFIDWLDHEELVSLIEYLGCASWRQLAGECSPPQPCLGCGPCSLASNL